jgi:peptidoglycan hydrolase FlgJ
MDLSAIGSMYLKNPELGSRLSGAAGPAATTSSFDLMLKTAAKAEASATKAASSERARSGHGSAYGRPLGAAANAGATDSAHATKSRVAIDRTDKLYEQCRELESFVIKNLLEGMRKTVQKSGFMEGGFAGEMYEDMLYDEYATSLSKNAGFGLADQAYLELNGRRGHA